MAPKRKISPFALFSLAARVTKFHFCVHFLFSLSFSLSFSAVNHASKPRARSGSLSIFLAEGIFFTRFSCCRVLYFFPSSVKPYHHKVFFASSSRVSRPLCLHVAPLPPWVRVLQCCDEKKSALILVGVFQSRFAASL